MTTVVICFVICLWFWKSFLKTMWTQIRLLLWVHTVCLYAKIGLKSLQKYSADDINRWHFQMQVFLGILRVKRLNLMHSIMDKIFSGHVEIYFLFFPENKICHFMQIVSNGDKLHAMSNPVFWEKIRKISSIYHLPNLPRVGVKVKY